MDEADTLHYDGDNFVPQNSAANYSMCLVEKGGRILGIEGFTVRDGTVFPRPDLIADFSAIHTPAESLNEALSFLSRLKDEQDLYFVVTALHD